MVNLKFHMSHETEGLVLMVNRGLRELEDEPQGFTVCRKCFAWLLSPNAESKHVGTTDHQGECSQHAHNTDLARGLWLTHQQMSDLLILDVPLPDGAVKDAFYTTLLHTLLRGIMVAFQLDESEIDGFTLAHPEKPDQLRILLFETSLGGSGVLASLVEPGRLATLFGRARELLHEGDPEGGCESACYDCLMSFYNQRDHSQLNRSPVLAWLQSLGDIDIQAADGDGDSRLQTLLAECQSELERQVLESIVDQGLRLPDAGQKTIYDFDGAPLAIADFFYEPRIVVFVDGSPHHLDYVQAADERKRRRLMALGYRVVVIHGESVEADIQILKERIT